MRKHTFGSIGTPEGLYRVDTKGHTASAIYANGRHRGGDPMLFIKGYFADGKHILAFFSHSPWGRVRNQHRGWVLLRFRSETTKRVAVVVDVCETFYWGDTSAFYQSDYLGTYIRNWHHWRKLLRERFGKLKPALSDFGTPQWSMTEEL